MDATDSDTVPRQPEEPTPQQVLDEMDPGEPYTTYDLKDRFPHASRWTIQRRLDRLAEDGEILKKKHTENRVSYWIEEE